MKEFFAAHWLELVLAAVLIYYAVDGYSRGFLLLLETAGFFIALVVSLLLYRFPAKLIEARMAIPFSFAAAGAFFLVWWTVDLLWPLAAGPLWRHLPEKWRKSKLNRWFGVAPGLLNGFMLLSVLLTVALAFPLPPAYKKQITKSVVARPMLALSSGLDAAMKPILGPIAEQSLNLITVRPQTGETLDLHFTAHDVSPDPDSEQRMLALVNQERKKRGLDPLEWSTPLRAVARAHSDDMFRRGYFSHTDPDGLNPADRIARAGIAHAIVGENLALAPDVETAHQGLMNSPGHRANILEPRFKKTGIGVIDGGVYGKMFTQLFTD